MFSLLSIPRFGSSKSVWAALAFSLALLLPVSRSCATLAWDGENFYVVNTLVGADRFYNAGIFGQGTFSANVEAGLVLGGQDWLKNVDDYYVPTGALNQSSEHATAVGTVMAAFDPNADLNSYPYYKFGMAPYTTLSSGAIATSYGEDGAFEISASTFYHAYEHYFTKSWDQTVNLGGGITMTRSVPTSVINSSWGFSDPTGKDEATRALDGFARAYSQTTFVVAAGNENTPETPSNNVSGPASGYNSISVGAIGDGTPEGIYSVAPFSSRGPQDFEFPDGTVVKGVRAPVDIVAPGVWIVTAVDEVADTADIMSGTSFAAPIVAAGVSLLNTLSYQMELGGEIPMGGSSRDGRVIKAVLLNSATKLAGWDNGQRVNAQGVTVTTQALDWVQGAGLLNLDRAYDQYRSGTMDVPGTGGGVVLPLGWDFGRLSLSGDLDFVAHNDYTINLTLPATAILDVTLSWFSNTGLPVLMDNADPLLQSITTDQAGFANLYLEIWDANFTHLFATSMADYDTIQELHFMVPLEGEYGIRVLYAKQLYGEDVPEDYGLAWYVEYVDPVPEPGSAALLGVGCVIVFVLVRKRMVASRRVNV